MTRKEYLRIGLVLLIGSVLGLLILFSTQKRAATDDHGHAHQEGGDHKGHSHAGEENHATKPGAQERHDHDKPLGRGKAEGGNREPGQTAKDKADDHDHDGQGHDSPARVPSSRHANEPVAPAAAVRDAEHDHDDCDDHDHDHAHGHDQKAGPGDKPRAVAPAADSHDHAAEEHQHHGFQRPDSHEGRETELPQAETRVEMGLEDAKAVGIEIRTAAPAQIGSLLELPGEVSFNADMVVHVVPRVSGVVAESFKNLGDPVKKGELVAVIDSREMAETKSRYLVYLKREELGRTNFERTENLWKKNVTTEQAYLNEKKALEEVRIELMAAAQKLLALGLSEKDVDEIAKTASGALARYDVRAPFDGVVVKKHMAIGEWVNENRDMVVLADLSTVWVEIIVYMKDLDHVQLGQKALVRSDASGQEATGLVSYVGPVVGEETRTARARVVIPNPDGRWRPGLFVTVQLVEDQVSVPVAVVSEALQSLGDKTVVFVRVGDAFEAKPLELGRRNGRHVEVVKGIAAGEQYVGKNSFMLKSQLGTAGLSHNH